MPKTTLQNSKFNLGIAKQGAKGTAATNPTLEPRWVDGDVSTDMNNVSDPYGDGHLFSSEQSARQLVAGKITPVLHAQPNITGALFAAAGFNDSVDDSDDPVFVHTLTEASGLPWYTIWKTVDTVIEKYTDCQLSKLTLTSNAADQFTKLETEFKSLSPGQHLSANPTYPGQEVHDAFVYTDGTGEFDLDGASISTEMKQIELTIEHDLEGQQGDDITHYDYARKASKITFTATVGLTADALKVYNTILYGTDTPTNGQLPAKEIYEGNFSFTLSAGTGDALRAITVTIPRAIFATETAINGQPEGGGIDLVITGQARRHTDGTIAEIVVTGDYATAF